jgi:hypothetical protein
MHIDCCDVCVPVLVMAFVGCGWCGCVFGIDDSDDSLSAGRVCWVEIFLMESLILAQDERWRRA